MILCIIPFDSWLGPPDTLLGLVIILLSVVAAAGLLFYILYIVNDVFIGRPIADMVFHTHGYYYGKKAAAVLRISITVLAIIGEMLLVVWLSSSAI